MPLIRPAIHYIAATPQRIFWAFALTHLVLWTLTPSITYPNLPLDVIEGYAWGKEWLIGTHKHPPMQAWILEILDTATGHAGWAAYLASQLAIITAFWAVWQTGRRIAGDAAGLVSAMLLEGIVYYNFTSPEFNPNVLQIPFWALAGWSFHKSVKDNKKIDWILFGVWAAGGMYSKYSSGLFLLALGAALLAHRDGRQRLLGPGPYLALLTGVVLFLPHFLWLTHNNFLPLEYTEDRLVRDTNHYSSATTTLFMVIGQIIAMLFSFFMITALYDRRSAPSGKPVASFDRIFVTFAAFGPFGVMVIVSSFFGYHIRDMWETPFWNFIGLWTVVFLRPALTPQDLRRFGMTWALTFLIGLLAFVANESLAPYVYDKPKRTIFPGKELSHLIVDNWHDRYHTPLRYVIGNMWPAGNVAWYSADRPHVFLDGDTRISSWIDTKDLRKSGGVIIWCIHCGHRRDSDLIPDIIQTSFPKAEIQPPLILNRLTSAKVPPTTIGWALVPPEDTP